MIGYIKILKWKIPIKLKWNTYSSHLHGELWRFKYIDFEFKRNLSDVEVDSDSLDELSNDDSVEENVRIPYLLPLIVT